MGAYFTISSIVYIFVYIIFFFSKPKVRNIETNVYKYFLITTFIGLIFDALAYFTFINGLNVNSLLYGLICKTTFLYFIAWAFEFSYYIYSISYSSKMNDESLKKLKKFKKILIILFWISAFLIYTLPVSFNAVNNVVTPDGISCALTYIIFGISIVVSSILSFINMKTIISKKYTPLYLFIVMIVIIFMIQRAYPHLFLINFGFALVVIIMYHTIENPDVQMINELYKNKMLVEKTYEEKSNFLFKMTQEVKKPINNMNNILASLKMSDEKNELKQGVKLLEANGKQLSFVVNDVLDITTLDARNIKIMNSRYNVYTLFKDIEKRMAEYASDEVEFRFEVDDNIPYLYGDAIKLKQIVMSILLNSIKKTKSGFIELTVNSIMKYDVCRLIIEVEDSGVGMSIDKINELMVTTSELSVDEINNLEKIDLNLDLCQKSIKLLGGNLMIRSEVGKGTEVIITLDQKIYESESKTNEIEKYQNMMYNDKRILIVSEKEDEIEEIKNKIDTKEIIVSTSLYANDAIDKIRSGKKYDLILMSDEMESKSGLTTLRELKGIKEFDMPVVVMLESDKEKIKEH